MIASCAVLRPRLAAGDRRVEEAQPLVVGETGERARHLRRGGGVIDEDGALPHAGQRAQFAEGDAAQIVVVADAGEHELGFARRLGRRIGQAAAELLHPGFGLGRASGCRR